MIMLRRLPLSIILRRNVNARSFYATTIIKTNTKSNFQPDLKDFLAVSKNFNEPLTENVPYLNFPDYSGHDRKVFLEVYGCQMNVSDAEIVWAILKKNQYLKVEDPDHADVILLITCAIREGAESKIWNRLKHLHSMKTKRSKKEPLQVGVLGCMAGRLKEKLLEKEKWVDVIAGTDSYKDLPRLLALTNSTNQSMVNVLLSLDETYADIRPVRLNSDSVTAFVSIMRGCDNMCTYCIVPFTRGRERSRPLPSIESEVRDLVKDGVKEITLLGQNVNSYRDISDPATKTKEATNLVPGFRTVYKSKVGGIRFAELLERVAELVPEVRIRFTSPHPKDFPDAVIDVIKKHNNICKSLHMPAQSGSTQVLDRMRRGYTRESYIELIKHIRSKIPEVSFSTDMICGFCGETEEEFADSISLMQEIKFNVAYLFAYSMREKTTAHRRLEDNVPKTEKMKRVQEIMRVFRECATEAQSKFEGTEQLILIEGKSKRSDQQLFGRCDANIKVIVPSEEIPTNRIDKGKLPMKPGDFVKVRVLSTNSQVLIGEPICHSSLRSH